MKYWVFQSNQVLGPYDPDALSRMATFSADSLVCPEGRRGTSMGDWLRAGTVPDLSVALTRAAREHMAQGAVATLAGLPAEPTLRDLAAIGSLQEKTGLIEDALEQVQQSSKVKDAELNELRQTIADKDRVAAELKQAIAERQRQAESLQAESASLRSESEEAKRKITELEQRLGQVQGGLGGQVQGLGESINQINQAVEEQKRVAQNVQAHDSTISGLTREIEALRTQLKEIQDRPSTPAFVSAPASAPLSIPKPARVMSVDPEPPPPQAFLAPSPSPAPAALDLTPPASPPPAAAPAPAPTPSFLAPETSPFSASPSAAPLTAFGSSPDSSVGMPTFDPLSPTMAVPAAEPSFGSAPPITGANIMSRPRRRSVLPLILVLGALGGGAWLFLNFGDRMKTLVPAKLPTNLPTSLPPGLKEKLSSQLTSLLSDPRLAAWKSILGLRTPPAPAGLNESAPLPIPSPTPEPSGGEAGPPVAGGGPIADPRAAAIEIAKNKPLLDGRTLEQALQSLSPSSDDPWFAEPQPSGLVRVNYSAHGAPGSTTATYGFVVNPGAGTVSGYDSAGKAVLAGKAVPPPAPPKAAKVRLKPKPRPKAKPAPKPESLDSLLGGEDGAAAPAAPAQRPAKAKADAGPKPAQLDDLLGN